MRTKNSVQLFYSRPFPVVSGSCRNTNSQLSFNIYFCKFWTFCNLNLFCYMDMAPADCILDTETNISAVYIKMHGGLSYIVKTCSKIMYWMQYLLAECGDLDAREISFCLCPSLASLCKGCKQLTRIKKVFFCFPSLSSFQFKGDSEGITFFFLICFFVIFFDEMRNQS